MESDDELGRSFFDGDEEENLARVLRLKFDKSYDSVREMMFKKNKSSGPDPENKPPARTLFLSNIPPWADADGISRIFSANGKVENVFLSKRPSSNFPENFILDPARPPTNFGFGHVVFEKPSSMKKALDEMDLETTYFISTDENPVDNIGVKRWKRIYNQSILPDEKVDELKKAIEDFVHETDIKRSEDKAKAEEEAEPDDDGWVTVSRKSKKKSTIGAGKSEKVKARLKAKEAKRKRNRELRNFYKFQLKETKLKRLNDLREKFEVDKEKQRKMVADRKFRPQ